MITARIKWGKETVDVEVDLSATVAEFRLSIERKTGVPAARQKISSAKGPLKDDTDLRTLGIESGKPLMLIGTAEAPPQRPTEQIVFAEDAPAGHAPTEADSNGLVNLGNTCYLNSVIQVLRVVPELRHLLAQSKNQVATSLNGLYQKLDATRDPVQPLLFWTSFMAGFPAFSRTDDHGRPMQHDSQEALTSILESAGQLQAPDEQALFRGRIGDEPFTMLSCSITADVQLLETGIERSLIDSSGAPRKVTRLPPYILVHVIRFAWRADTKENAKVLRPVAFPLVLDMQPFCSDELKAELEPHRSLAMARRDAELARRKKEKLKSGHDDADANPAAALPPGPDGISGFYELAGVITHKGRTLDGGHYVAWTKKKDTWLLHDDDHVGAVTTEDILRLRGVGEAHIAYVLLYRCRSEAGHAPYVS